MNNFQHYAADYSATFTKPPLQNILTAYRCEAVMQKAIVLTTLCLSMMTPAHAQQSPFGPRPPLLVEAPCGWFVKTAPYVWSANHVIRVDTWGVVSGLISFGPGSYRVDDGTDAYELVERKCGHGAVPASIYRSAMPLPFGLAPWYQ